MIEDFAINYPERERITMKKTICALLALILVLALTPAVSAANVSFTDVSPAHYYAKPVSWAVANGITTGMGNNKFMPNDACTRAQVVTFLWRAAGEPEPSSTYSPFHDVSTSSYYYKAVLWAIEKGITNGTDSTHFSPDATCTRSQIATFLWRAEGKPAYTSVPGYAPVKNPVKLYLNALGGVSSSARGILSDLDGDGIQELILNHTELKVQMDGYDVNQYSYTLYTIQNGALTKVSEEALTPEAGVCEGYAGIVKYNNETLLLVHSAESEPIDNTSTGGEESETVDRLYRFENGKLTLVHTLIATQKYRYWTKYSLDGVQCSESTYNSMVGHISSLERNGSFASTTRYTGDQIYRNTLRTYLNNQSDLPAPFMDLQKSSFYYHAAIWAYHSGVVNGIDVNHFGPSTTCTRGMVVTMLYRLYN